MSELVPVTTAQAPEEEGAILVGIDDGYACTKVALDGRLISIPSTGRIGSANVSWLPRAKQLIFEYETEGVTYSIGQVDAEPTRYDGYATSGLNRAIVQHALQCADLGGRDIIAASGMPVSAFYSKSGMRRDGDIEDKWENLIGSATPSGGGDPADIIEHHVIPEALAAWYDHVVIPDGNGGATLDYLSAAAPIAVVDIGGRTTDTVVVRDRAIIHDSSGSHTLGVLDAVDAFAQEVENYLGVNFSDRSMITHAFDEGSIPYYGVMHDFSGAVTRAKTELAARLYSVVRRQLGTGADLHQILLVGGGALALGDEISRWFPNQIVAKDPEFANARGLLKYLAFVCVDEDEF